MASKPPLKSEINVLRDFLVRQMGKLGIEVNLMTDVTPELVLRKKPDVLLLAVGGRPVKPSSIPFDPKMNCVFAWDAISGKEKVPGKRVVILGGGFVASEIGEFFAEQGKEITLIEMRDLIAFDLEPNFRQMLVERLNGLKVNMVTKTIVQEVTAKGVKGKSAEDGSIKEFPADAVLIALGSEVVPFPVEEIEKAGIEVRFIGDAKEIHGISEAIRDAYVAGNNI